MANIKINNKSYTIPNLQFRHYALMEEQGISLIEAFQKRQIMLLAMAFVCAVVDCDREEAERLIEQHILGGGNLVSITEAMYKAIGESDFFKRMLQTEEPKKSPKKSAEANE